MMLVTLLLLFPIDKLGEIAVADKHIFIFPIVGCMHGHWIIHTIDSFISFIFFSI